MAETTLLSLRPTRLIFLQYYVGWIFAWIVALVFWWNPGEFMPSWVVPVLGVHVKTVLALLLGFLGLVAVLGAEIRRRKIRYEITDNRIIRTDGIIRRRTMEIPYTQIERVELEQGLLQRMLGFGNLVLDTGEDTETLQSLRHVRLVHDEVIKHIGTASYRLPSQR